jgi:ferrous iron transport protein B
MLILPFMSCSARLPVYILIISAFFPTSQGSILFGIYLLGILLAVISALIFKKLFFRKDDTPFVMELPPYRMPTLRNTARHMWNKAYQYLQKIGGIILVASIIIWGLNYYPTNSKLLSADKNNTKEQTEATDEKMSYLERLGKTIQPVMEPMGFDWKMTVSLLSGVTAKEVVVSTMGVIYEVDESNVGLGERLKKEMHAKGEKAGQPVYSPAVALAFLIFTLIYFPCIAVIATVSKESGTFKWSALLVGYTTILAWFMSFVTYKIVNFII